ncbi:hypothetical protein B0H21DRAFT_879595 [Amylocystis lapponica]|nr:hypothetical protein B0H21DRAFT_879595 [Amylocystis lapponica]
MPHNQSSNVPPGPQQFTFIHAYEAQQNSRISPPSNTSTLHQQITTSIPESPLPNARQPKRTPTEKLATVLHTLQDLNWTLSEFLYALFRVKDDNGQRIERNEPHRTMMSRFLSGGTKYTFADILSAVMQDPGGLPKGDSAEMEDTPYSLAKSYVVIKHARPAIATMAVEFVRGELLKEIRVTVQSTHGLHGSMPAARRGGHMQLCWNDIGTSTVSKVTEILRETHPLGFDLLLHLATPKPRKVNGVLVTRKTRPPLLTITEILSDIAYCRTSHARLLPAARGILYFACGAQQTLFDYNSRVGHTPSWNTTNATLKRLADQDAEVVRAIGRDATRAAILRFDNVQKYAKQREMRLGRETAMKIGIAANVAEAVDYNSAATDIQDKRARIAENKRAGLTVYQLLKMIDLDHIATVGTLQWLQVLVTYIPQLAQYRGDVTKLYHSDATRLAVPRNRKTNLHPLATVAKNEAIVTELRDALVDFLDQMGQQDEDFVERLIFVGGDGLTFAQLNQLKRLLRDQANEFRRFELIQPFLEIWHTEWTFLSHTQETHWGDPLTKDPAKLGHSAVKINQKPPSNLKKVDFYPAAHLSYIVLDVRMLDCWRIFLGAEDIFEHFAALGASGTVPTLAELHRSARVLYERYSSQEAYRNALGGILGTGNLAFPQGASWHPPKEDTSSQSAISSGKKRGKGKAPPMNANANKNSSTSTGRAPADTTSEPKPKKPKEPPMEPFTGDQSLAHSIIFIRDTILSREVARAVAEGDAGRVYEALKMMMFCFAGSSHTKYTGYLLEMIASLELESSDTLRDFFLRNWLVNPSGEPGKYQEGDLMQEHYNRELETFIERKDVEWDADYIRRVIAPNVGHFVTLKNAWGDGLGLAKRRGAHPEPHSRPEVSILLNTYKDEDLHRFRAGRCYGSPGEDIDTFAKGITELDNGKLKNWIQQTTQDRSLHPTTSAPVHTDTERHSTGSDSETVERSDEEDVLWDDGDSEDGADETPVLTLGSIDVFDGETTVYYQNVESANEELEAGLRELDDEETELGLPQNDMDSPAEDS